MRTYTFKVVIEPDGNFDRHLYGWHAYCPALDQQGTSTLGETPEEAFKNVDEVVHLVVESMLAHGKHIPKNR